MTGIELITQEREEQLTKHNRTIKADKAYNKHYQLLDAVVKLASFTGEETDDDLMIKAWEYAPQWWDKTIWDKLISKTYKERLVIIGAFAAAEIDRIS